MVEGVKVAIWPAVSETGSWGRFWARGFFSWYVDESKGP